MSELTLEMLLLVPSAATRATALRLREHRDEVEAVNRRQGTAASESSPSARPGPVATLDYGRSSSSSPNRAAATELRLLRPAGRGRIGRVVNAAQAVHNWLVDTDARVLACARFPVAGHRQRYAAHMRRLSALIVASSLAVSAQADVAPPIPRTSVGACIGMMPGEARLSDRGKKAIYKLGELAASERWKEIIWVGGKTDGVNVMLDWSRVLAIRDALVQQRPAIALKYLGLSQIEGQTGLPDWCKDGDTRISLTFEGPKPLPLACRFDISCELVCDDSLCEFKAL